MTIRYIREHIYKTFAGKRYKALAKSNDKRQALNLASRVRDKGSLCRIESSQKPGLIYKHIIYKGPKSR